MARSVIKPGSLKLQSEEISVLPKTIGAAAGLYGAIFIAFFAALFGGTETQISGPTAPMTAVSMVIIAGIVQTNEGVMEKALPAILMVFLLAGIFQIILGLFGVAKCIYFQHFLQQPALFFRLQ